MFVGFKPYSDNYATLQLLTRKAVLQVLKPCPIWKLILSTNQKRPIFITVIRFVFSEYSKYPSIV
jgi:hypothetical protein